MAVRVEDSRLGDTTRAAVPALVRGSIANLLGTWSQGDALFPYSSRFVSGEVVNDYAHPTAARYTMGSLLGLGRASAYMLAPPADDVRVMYDSFHRRRPMDQAPLADFGMLALLAVELNDEETAATAVRRIGSLLDESLRGVVMQDVAWAVWGMCVAHRAGIHGASAIVQRLRHVLTVDLMSPAGLPHHSARQYRRGLVSFGALTYFLRALHELAVSLDDEEADALFRRGVESTLELQQDRGQWPWMIDSERRRALDTYPVFAVHQDSMAMLFLHPALDRELAGVAESIDASLRWSLGDNELGVPMYADDPFFFAFRSIERAERAPRLRRYLRSSAARVGSTKATVDTKALRLNNECRSYHPGWILYVWSDRITEHVATR